MGQALGVKTQGTSMVSLQLKDGRLLQARYIPDGGLGYTPWPGNFAMARYLDTHKDELKLSERHVIELGSGACSVSGLMAGIHCKKVELTDRLEVLEEIDAAIGFAFQGMSPMPNCSAKVLDWADLEFTETAFTPGKADTLMMSDVVYFPMLKNPLVHTLLFLCNANTEVLWANCDRYPSYVPDMEDFLQLIREFFDISELEERPQQGLGGPNEVIGGRVCIRSLRLSSDPAKVAAAKEELEMAKIGGPVESCAKRCFF
mmetsp:Transcript_20246/g.36105  ORF Transcript_20246/g.36105 Transcript_20246/m.36105 type:complete len:259 (+) Transcript_20246:112-888(+)|eukprot:CAMPEP_0197660022 /NCGR_PEP_ID=MMETSP1338-20131121/50103_1 /TAXON_ID=43686 ORGANISM="Pelagodinium beii, Strain RCC1491" /NCGR_SAMPLE_ID=MMETSP1338 /ASSEMBLY_ACC=CAM_ASM_000754 /LENGTH=258 /DNA_ID=CAMNT_0043237253 /DNA_START=112 /DNA_END=888 /DNA_ORIENTATION=+